MVFSVTCTICEGPNLDAYKSQSVTYANCHYDIIRQHKQLLLTENLFTSSQLVLHIGILEMTMLHFSMQGKDSIEHTNITSLNNMGP